MPSSDSRLALILGPLLACILAYLFFTGLYCSDDTRYMGGILKIAGGGWIDLTSIAERRLIFLLPGALGYAVSRSIDISIATYAIFYVLIPACTWFLARSLGPRNALSSAVASVAIPNLYVYAGALFPDVTSAFLSAASMACVYLLLSTKSVRRTRWLAFAAGVLSMLGICVKESNAVLAILPPAIMVLEGLTFKNYRRAVVSLGIFGLGVVVVLAAELFSFRYFSGYWHTSFQNQASDHGFAAHVAKQGLYPNERFRFLAFILDDWTLGLFILATLTCAFVFWRWIRVRDVESLRLLVPAVYFLWPLIYFTVGSASFKEYMPPVMQARYYAPCVPPAAVLLGIALQRICLSRRYLEAIAAFVVVFTLALGVALNFGNRGTVYWARAKDAILLTIADVKAADSHARVVIIDGAVNTEVARCVRLLAQDSGLNEVEFSDSHVGTLPFFVMGTSLSRLKGDESLVVQSIRSNAADGKWQVGMVGYYYADEKADDTSWWLPRQFAVKRVHMNNPDAFREREIPGGYIPWMKREMHAELFYIQDGAGFR